MHNKFLKSLVLVAIAALAAFVAPSARAQGVTTSSLSGSVTDKSGKPLAGATVVVVNVPTNSHTTTVTRSNGQYNLSGLQVGGPYTVIVTAAASAPESKEGLFLDLAGPTVADFTIGGDVVQLEAFNVTGTKDTTFSADKMGTGSSYNSREIADIPTVRRDVQDIANLDPRFSLSVNNGGIEWSMSAQGQNSRYNSFLVDGMQSNDPFGLNANGISSLRSPVPLEALASVSIDLSPYDVTKTGFTGALINTVTKSGTNEFHGSVYGYYTGKSLRAENPLTQQKDQLQERTSGLTFGGPLIKNKLFFFLAYENYDRIQASPGQNFQVNAADLAAITAAAKVWGYDPGTISGTNESTQRTFLGKLDWNINDQQHLSFSFRRTNSSTPTFADYTGTTYTSMSNHWYIAKRKTDNYSLQLNSQWTPDLRTDVGASIIRYNGTASPNGSPFPEVYINGVTGTRLDTGAAVTNGQMDLGTNYSYQLNKLVTKDVNGHAYAEYSLGDHTLKAGADVDKSQSLDEFVQYYYGRYAFASIADFAAGFANYLRYQQPPAGRTIPESYADYSLTNVGFLAQDTWRPNQSLTVVGGLRYDYPYIPGKPPYLASFQTTFGMTNNTTGTGNGLIEPRFGFNYRLPKNNPIAGILGGRSTQVRGGLGLFQGTNPAVWVANAFDTTGALNAVQLGSATTSTTHGTIAFNANPTYVQGLTPPTAPQANIDIIDPDFRTPSSWKGNFAVDHTLPWLDIVATAEANYIKVNKAIYLTSMNLKPYGTAPDGRILYNAFVNSTTGKTNGSQYLYSSFAAVIDMQNTNQGGSEEYSLSLHRALKNGWAFSLAYSHTHATEVQPLTSSVATSSYNYRATYNPNENVARTSSYEVPNKFVASVSREFNFFGSKSALSRATLVFRAQTGHAYSWVFSGDANGDGITGNDSFYVPTGASDPTVTWADATQKANFFNFIQTTDLKKYAGQVVPANSTFSAWQHTLDLHLEQDIPTYRKVKLSLFADCLNFANLFDKSWGVVNQLDFGTSYNGYNRSVAQANYNPTTKTYAYSFTSSTLGSPITFTDLSRWQIQVGAKLSF